MARKVIAFLGRAERDATGANQMRCLFNQLQLHADIDEGRVLSVEEVGNQLPDGGTVDAGEHEVETGERRDVVGSDELWMRDHAPAHAAVDVGVVLNLEAPGA